MAHKDERVTYLLKLTSLNGVAFDGTRDGSKDLIAGLIRQDRHLKWVFHTFGKTDINYHKAVIFGFTKIAVKNYTVDPDGLVATYGHRIVAGLDVDENLFNLILVSTREKA